MPAWAKPMTSVGAGRPDPQTHQGHDHIAEQHAQAGPAAQRLHLVDGRPDMPAYRTWLQYYPMATSTWRGAAAVRSHSGSYARWLTGTPSPRLPWGCSRT